jgi:hypothetical protein
MRRILLVLSAGLVMVALVVVTAAPAFAKNTFQTGDDQPPGPPSISGAGTTVFHCNSPDIIGERGAIVINKIGRHDNCDVSL